MRRGYVAQAVMLAVLGVATAMVVALDHRGTDLTFEARSACRVAARAAAESAIARGRARLEAGRSLESIKGDLQAGVTYRLKVRRSSRSAVLTGLGWCESRGHRSAARVQSVWVRTPSGWQIDRWEELPVPRPAACRPQ